MIRNELINLIANSFFQGKKEKEIKKSLNAAGWEKGDIQDTINYAVKNSKMPAAVFRVYEKEKTASFWAVVLVILALLAGEIFSRLAGFSFIFRIFS